MSMEKVLAGMLTGVGIGVVLGVLFALDKGSTTRKRFSRKGVGYTTELEEKFNSLIDNITNQFETLVEEVNEMTEKDNAKA